MDFQFHSPTRLITGCGKSAKLGELDVIKGTKAFVVIGPSLSSNGLATHILDSLSVHHIAVHEYVKPDGEPTLGMTDEAAEIARREECSAVISIGGGSVIDLGKAVAGLVTNDGSVLDYLEGVGTGKTVTQPALPHVAVPTPAGAGA